MAAHKLQKERSKARIRNSFKSCYWFGKIKENVGDETSPQKIYEIRNFLYWQRFPASQSYWAGECLEVEGGIRVGAGIVLHNDVHIVIHTGSQQQQKKEVTKPHHVGNHTISCLSRHPYI